MTAHERRRPGRPPLACDDRSVSVHFRLPNKQYDDLWQRAARERLTVADFIRKRLKPPTKPD